MFNEGHARETAKDFMNVPGVAKLELGTTLAGVKRRVSELHVENFSTLLCCMAASFLSRLFFWTSLSVLSSPTK